MCKGNCLKRFCSLFNIVAEFFQDSNSGLCDDLQIIKDKISYFSYILTKFNETTLQLQRNDIKLIKVKSNCKLFKRNLARHEFYQFPSLSELNKKNISNDNFQVHCAHLKALERDMSEKFQDIASCLRSTWSRFITQSLHSIVSLGKTFYGAFPYLVVLASSFKIQLDIYKITNGQQYLGISGRRLG